MSLALLTPSGNTIEIYSTAETILGRHSTLEVRSIHLGGLFHAEEEIQMTSTMANFVGQMQGFVYNGQRYILLALLFIKCDWICNSVLPFQLRNQIY